MVSRVVAEAQNYTSCRQSAITQCENQKLHTFRTHHIRVRGVIGRRLGTARGGDEDYFSTTRRQYSWPGPPSCLAGQNEPDSVCPSVTVACVPMLHTNANDTLTTKLESCVFVHVWAVAEDCITCQPDMETCKSKCLHFRQDHSHAPHIVSSNVTMLLHGAWSSATRAGLPV